MLAAVKSEMTLERSLIRLVGFSRMDGVAGSVIDGGSVIVGRLLTLNDKDVEPGRVTEGRLSRGLVGKALRFKDSVIGIVIEGTLMVVGRALRFRVGVSGSENEGTLVIVGRSLRFKGNEGVPTGMVPEGRLSNSDVGKSLGFSGKEGVPVGRVIDRRLVMRLVGKSLRFNVIEVVMGRVPVGRLTRTLVGKSLRFNGKDVVIGSVT